MKNNSWENTRKKERKLCVKISIIRKKKKKEKKEHIKIEGSKRKKIKRDNLDNNEKEQLRKYG